MFVLELTGKNYKENFFPRFIFNDESLSWIISPEFSLIEAQQHILMDYFRASFSVSIFQVTSNFL